MIIEKLNPDYNNIVSLIKLNIQRSPLNKLLLENNSGILNTLIQKEISELNEITTEFISEEDSCGLIAFSEKPWESSIFNKKFGAIKAIYVSKANKVLINRLLDLVMKWASENNIFFLSYRTPDKSDVKLIELLNKSLCAKNFYCVETLLTFVHDFDEDIKTELKGDINVKLFSKESYSEENPVIIRVAEIARQSFSLDRMHSDPNIDDELADESRLVWIKNVAKGRGKLFYSVENNFVNGFLGFKDMIFDDLKVSSIELIAAGPKHTGKGIGVHLIKNYLEYLNKHKYTLGLVGTQEKNIYAVKLYKKCGYKLLSSNNTYHWCSKGD